MRSRALSAQSRRLPYSTREPPPGVCLVSSCHGGKAEHGEMTLHAPTTKTMASENPCLRWPKLACTPRLEPDSPPGVDAVPAVPPGRRAEGGRIEPLALAFRGSKSAYSMSVSVVCCVTWLNHDEHLKAGNPARWSACAYINNPPSWLSQRSLRLLVP